MKHINLPRKTIVLISVFLIIILCGAFYFGVVSSVDNTENDGVITYTNLTPIEKQKLEKELELKRTLQDFDDNIVYVSMYLEDSDNEITFASIFIVSEEDITDSAQKDKLMVLASERLNLDSENIEMDYMDVATFTSQGEINE